MEAEIFENCSGFTEGQITAVAFARGSTATICCVILLIVLVVLTILTARQKSRLRVSGTIVKRLTIWLTAVTVLYELILALNRRYYFDPSDVAFCVADGFLIQYVGSVQFLFTQLGISLIKLWEVAAPCKPAILLISFKKSEQVHPVV